MAKLNIDKGAVLNLTAKSVDTFSLTTEIEVEDGSILTFELPEDSLIVTELLLFVVFAQDYEPLLLACNAPLEISSNFENDSDLNKRKHVRASAVAKYLSEFAGNNTYIEEITNYFTDANNSTTILNAPTTGVFSTLLSKFKKIDSSLPEPLASVNISEFNNGKNYIASGIITGVNPITISFDANDFKLPKGNYKYAVKQLTNPRPINTTIVSGVYKYQFMDCITWLHGKFKIKE